MKLQISIMCSHKQEKICTAQLKSKHETKKKKRINCGFLLSFTFPSTSLIKLLIGEKKSIRNQFSKCHNKIDLTLAHSDHPTRFQIIIKIITYNYKLNNILQRLTRLVKAY